MLNSPLDLGVEDRPYSRYFIPASTEPIRKKIYETKILPVKPSAFVNTSHGIERMRQGMYAFHMESGIGYKLVARTFQEHEKCGLVEISFLEVIDPWYGIAKDSPYKEIIKTK